MSKVVQYENRKKVTSYLYEKSSKKGLICYYFSSKLKENPLKEIPEGYEIWEHPETYQVFLRKIIPCLITQEEKEVLQLFMKELCPLRLFRIDIKSGEIVIYVAQDISGFSTRGFFAGAIDTSLDLYAYYSAQFRFTLIDPEKRVFSAERWCYFGSIDDWIFIGNLSSLEFLCKKHFPHLGQDSYYDLD